MPDIFLWQEFAVYLALGALAGVMAGLLGVGGGLVIVPVLLGVFAWLGFAPEIMVHLAIGTSLATIVITSISSIRAHQRRGAILWPLFWRLTPGILIGAWLGAWVAESLPELWLRRVFAVFALTVGSRMLLGASDEARWALPGRLGMGLAGTLIGAVSAIVGIGGGSMTVPFLHACRVGMRQAVATSSACGLPIAVSGALGFVWAGWGHSQLPPLSSGFVYWPAFAGIVLTSTLLAPVGARLAHSLPLEVLKRVFALLLLAVGLKLLLG